MSKEKEGQATSLQLTKVSTSAEMKTYFTKVFELKQSGKEFPIDLEMVWPLLYGRKTEAVDALRESTDFIEGIDYNLRQQAKVVKSNELKNGIRIDVELSVPCMEFFIARKIRPVFEVYRQVFHLTAENAKKQLAETVSGYSENTVITVKMGKTVNQIYINNGIVYAKFSPIMRHLGYMDSGGTQYINRIGREYFIQVECGKQQAWFIDREGFNELLKISVLSINSSTVKDIYCMYKLEKPKGLSEYSYQFTDSEMLDIVNAVFKSPINKQCVHQLLLNGKREGGIL